MTRRNVRHYSPASGRMTSNTFLWRHMEHGWYHQALAPEAIRAITRKGCFNEDDKWQCVVRIYFIMIFEYVRSYKFYLKLRLTSRFTFTRTVTLQDVPLLKVTSGRPYGTTGVSILVCLSGKWPKIATSNVIFLRTTDRITAKVLKYKPNDIFQNCVHSTSTLNVTSIHHWYWKCQLRIAITCTIYHRCNS